MEERASLRTCLRADELTSRLSIDGRRHTTKQNGTGRTPAAELSLNAAALRAEIARSYEEFLDIFDTFYADDVEVSREDLREMIRGKATVRPFLLNVLVPLHVMAEVAGLSINGSADCGSRRHSLRHACCMEGRLDRRRRQALHFEMVRHSENRIRLRADLDLSSVFINSI